jgi:hypothetical protein
MTRKIDKKMASTLTENDVIRIVKKENEEMFKCFNKLTTDLDTLKKGQQRLERALLGDKEFEDKGLVSMVNYSYEYTRKNIESKLVDRAELALKKFTVYEENGFWKVLEEIVDKYKALKWLTALIVGSGIISVANVITIILKALGISS